MKMRREESAIRLALASIMPGSGRRGGPGSGHPVGTCTGIALLALAPAAAQAIVLGDIVVRSPIGQPLAASIPVQLGPDEALAAECVSAAPGDPALRGLAQVQVTVPNASGPGSYLLGLATRGSLHEPMYELSVVVRCPGAPTVIRQYVVMLDLPGQAVAEAKAAMIPVPAISAGTPAAAPTVVAEAVPEAPRRPAPARTRGSRSAVGSPLATGERYRVAPGDTLLGIAYRTGARGARQLALADEIFRANPDAFIRSNPDLIRLGSEIVIPGSATAPASIQPSAVLAATATAAGPVPMQAARREESATAGEPPAPPPAASEPAPAPEDQASDVGSETASNTPPVEAADAAAPAEAPVEAPAEAAASPETEAPASTPNPLVSVIAGVLFGLLVSALLWSRRIRDAARGSRPAMAAGAGSAADSSDAELSAEVADRAPGPPVVPAPVRAVEPAISVSYTAEDDPLAAEFARPYGTARPAEADEPVAQAGADDFTSELQELFDNDATAERSVLDVDLGGVDQLADVDLLLEDNSAPESGTHVTGNWTAQTVESPAQESPSLQTSGALDIASLARGSGGDASRAKDLMEALSLLERDYEEELTASQIIDRSAMRSALAGEEPAVAREHTRKPR